MILYTNMRKINLSNFIFLENKTNFFPLNSSSIRGVNCNLLLVKVIMVCLMITYLVLRKIRMRATMIKITILMTKKTNQVSLKNSKVKCMVCIYSFCLFVKGIESLRAANSDLFINISLEPNVADLRYFKL